MSPALRVVTLTEKDFQATVLEYAQLMGWKAYHTWNSMRSAPGFPDLVLVRGSRLIFAELKNVTGKLTPAQEEWLKALSQTVAEVYVWRPGDWEAIELALERSCRH
jgi:hypothetical protein